MARKLLNLGAGIVVVIALVWQVYNLARQNYGGKHAVDSGKLLRDIQSTDYKVQHQAASSIFMLAGVNEFRPQLLKAGVVPVLVEIAKTASLKDVSNELLPIALLSLAKIAKEEPEQGPRIIEGKVLGRLSNVLQANVPGWTAATATLLHALASTDPGIARRLAGKVIHGQEGPLVAAAISLTETGALGNHTDATVAGCRLAELVLSHGGGEARVQVLESGRLVQLLLQVLKSVGVSQVTGAVAQTLAVVVDVAPAARAKLVGEGAVPYLVHEMRQPNKFSLPGVLALLGRLALDEKGQADAVSAGALSLCGQLVFKYRADDRWRVACCALLSDVAKMPLPHGAEGDHGVQMRHAMAALMKLTREVSSVPLHNAVVDALRDMGDSKSAADEMAAQGALPVLAQLLARNVSDEHMAAKAWLMQTQRSAAMLAALIALQPHLRPPLAQAGLIEGLAACLRNHAGRDEGLWQQLRITAAAAFVPILTDYDSTLDVRVIESGMLEDLIAMFYSAHEGERTVAVKVLGLLERDKLVAEMFERVGIRIPAPVNARDAQRGQRQ